ncbi:toxin-antitoxin system, toxin component, PIN family protein [Ciceribacter thiooxidans]|uniref:PIN domain-containing protein n=1 Tax=Ciceribacter thiooxidans TaxID=1969821 RepID=A0ABV7I8W8_9HYPH|nr:toxin-antitoxin system, toxin component, PIN family protein [Ciceribacter thiooxidans]
MASKPPVAVYDACALYPFHLRNVLIQGAFDDLVEARWTDDIHDEWMVSVR